MQARRTISCRSILEEASSLEPWRQHLSVGGGGDLDLRGGRHHLGVQPQHGRGHPDGRRGPWSGVVAAVLERLCAVSAESERGRPRYGGRGAAHRAGSPLAPVRTAEIGARGGLSARAAGRRRLGALVWPVWSPPTRALIHA